MLSPFLPTVFPEHALLIVEERLREQQTEGVRMPEGLPLDELALRILIAAETGRIHLGGLNEALRECVHCLQPAVVVARWIVRRWGGKGVPLKRSAAVLVFALLAASCGSDGSPSTQETAQPATSGTQGAPALVGTWERLTRCEELVAALQQARLDQWVVEFVAGNGFVPGVTGPDQIDDPSDPCKGAVPREHSHFFTPDGEFGSLDWNGDPVDDGTYEIVDEDTFVISKEFPDVTFNYSVQGDTIMFDPVIPDCSPECFEAAWSVSVAYPGEEWHRASL